MPDRLHLYNTLLTDGLVPLFYEGDVSAAKQIIAACIEGGIHVVEFTNRGAQALKVFDELRQHYPKLLLGIGSIVDAPTAALFIAHGADFVVSPLLNPEVARICNRRKIAYMPGCASPTEISQAEELGVEIVKLFPGSLFSPEYVRAIKAPMPWTRIMPTGGVEPTEESVKAWFGAGVSCVGIGSKLIGKDYGMIAEKCAQTLAWIRQYRS